jgi:hypothetical protein
MNPAFVLAFFPLAVMAYLAIVDPSVRQTFGIIAGSGLTGFFGVTVPKKESSNPTPTTDPEQNN